MIDEPVPMMPLTMPAISPTARTKMNSKLSPHPEARARRAPKDGREHCARLTLRDARSLSSGRASRGPVGAPQGAAPLIPQLESLYLPRRGFRQAIDDLDPARIFPHADLPLHVLLQRFAQRFGVAGFGAV